MRNVHIDHQGSTLDFQSASHLAKGVARENHMQDPTIMAWHQSGDESTPPLYDGADPESWWAKYGTGNGGKLEVCIGDDFQFIMMDARGYETLGEMPLRNLSDSHGDQYVCFTPLLGTAASKPTPEACTKLDEWTGDQS